MRELLCGVVQDISRHASKAHRGLEINIFLPEPGKVCQQWPTQKELQVDEIGHLLLADEGVSEPGAPSSRRTTDPVHKQLRGRGKVKVDDILQQWDIDTTRGNICDNEDLRLSVPELGQIDLSRSLIQGTMSGI